MSEFSELIKNFDKVRDYMRDFYIYGFKTRSDFQCKSGRTYDNERRRIESWLGDLMHFDNLKKGKQVSISLDSGRLYENPLYRAYRSKSFTDNDIKLHFFLMDILSGSEPLSIDEITDKICSNYNMYFEPQTIRIKLKEYVSEDIVIQSKKGKAFLYSLSEEKPWDYVSKDNGLVDLIKFFTQSAPFGVIGSYLLEQLGIENDIFLMKHNFIVHTLEDNILFELIKAIDSKSLIQCVNFGKGNRNTKINCVPLKIYVSTQTGRRYLVSYIQDFKRFNSMRLDYIKSVKLLNIYSEFDKLLEKFERNSLKCWGISFGNNENVDRIEYFSMVIYIDEIKEQYILNRLYREGRNGSIKRLCENTFSYTVEIFDTNEMMPWVKSFIGRIISIEGTNKQIIDKFYSDINRMKRMYSNNKFTEDTEKEVRENGAFF